MDASAAADHSMNKTADGTGLSDVDEDDEEETTRSPQGTQNRHIRFVRLNNMPYSDLPKEILDTLNQQRQYKKSITLTTTKNFYNANKKGGADHGVAGQGKFKVKTILVFEKETFL